VANFGKKIVGESPKRAVVYIGQFSKIMFLTHNVGFGEGTGGVHKLFTAGGQPLNGMSQG
jgi:hypothetical protein